MNRASNPTKSPVGAVLVLAAAGLAAGPAIAAEPDGITVSGTGAVMARPTRVEIEVTAQGSAGLSSDALVKYRGAYRRMLDAYKKLKLPNLEIQEQALAIGRPGGSMNGPMAVPSAKAGAQISGTIKVALKGIQDMPRDELARAISTLLDTAKDAGASVGPAQGPSNIMQMMMAEMGQAGSSSLVVFVVDDAAKFHKQASRRASDDARQRAQDLAGQEGVYLGPVVSVHETPAGADEDSQVRAARMMFGAAAPAHSGDNRITAPTYREIPIQVNLTVRYAIQK